MKKLFTMLLCLIVGIGSMFAQVNASGTLSNGGTWKLQQGTLYVEASAIPNFKKSYVDGGAWHTKTTAPWWVYGQYINEIQVDGASTIGSWAFAGLTKVQRVVIAGVTSVEIGEYAFGGCSSLSSVDGFQYMTQIGQGAFMGCPLKYVVLPKVTSLGSFAFGSQDGSNASADVGYAKYTVMLNTSSVPTFDNIDFMLCDRAARLIVPASLKSQISALWDADAHNPQTNRMNREFQMQEICVGGLLNQNNSRNFWMLNDDGTLWVVGTMPDFAKSDTSADVASYVNENPDDGISRLFCVRPLEEKCHYTMFLVPAFELGRRAGMGESLEGAGFQQLAWDDQSSKLSFPVYYQWSFTTGGATFHELAKKQTFISDDEFKALPDGLKLDIQETGLKEYRTYTQTINEDKVLVDMPAALVKKGFDESKLAEETPQLKKMTRGGTNPVHMTDELKKLQLMSPVFSQNERDKAEDKEATMSETEDPWVVPPVYGWS